MIIQNNISALNNYRFFNKNNKKLSNNLEKLSSGYKINRSADDAAGLAVSEKMRSQIRGLDQAADNTSDGINLLQTAEGGCDEINAILNRMKNLAVQLSNGVYDNDVDRASAQLEYEHLIGEITQIAKSTDFNGVYMLCNPPTKTVTAPIDDVIMNRVQASVSTPPVNTNGSFKFYATNNVGDKSQLLYGSSSPSTSYPTIRVNGTEYRIWNLPRQGSDDSNGVWSTTYTLNTGVANLTITQKVSVVDNPASLGGQSYKIDYEVVNNNPANSVTFDLMYHVDTQLGINDRAPFTVGGQNIVNNTSYPRDGSIPGYIEIFDDINSPYINGVICVDSSSGLSFQPGSEPDKVNLGKYNQVNTFNNIPNGAVGDSGYSLIWENRTVTTNSVVMTTYYGVKNPPPDILNSTDRATIEVPVATWPIVLQTGSRGKDNMTVHRVDVCSEALGISATDINSQATANYAIDQIDKAIVEVSKARSYFGATQNRLEHKYDNINNNSENLQAAESRIRDADMAKEMMEYTKNSILSQSSQSMMAQAGNLTQGMLSLLQ